MAGLFSDNQLYATLYYNWWWENVYVDAVAFCRNCVECTMTAGFGREKWPPVEGLSVPLTTNWVLLVWWETPQLRRTSKWVHKLLSKVLQMITKKKSMRTSVVPEVTLQS